MNTIVWEGYKDIRPSTNFAAQAKICVEHKNLCRELFENFGKKLEATADRWAKRLTEQDFTMREVKTGIDHVVHTCEKLPSFAEFTNIIRNNSSRPDENLKEEQAINKQAQQLRELTQLAVEKFVAKYGQAQLDTYLQQWWDNVYQQCPETFGLPLKTFLPIFFQDFVQAKGDIHKTIEIGRNRAQVRNTA